MGKLVNSLLLVIAMELSMMMFLGASTPVMSLLQFIMNPEIFTESALITKITATLTLVAATGIVIGTLVNQYDFLVFGGLSLMFLSYAATIFVFYQKIAAMGVFTANTYIPILITTPILVIYVYVLLKFWRGSD